MSKKEKRARRDGYIEQRGEARFLVGVFVGRDAQGKQVRYTETVRGSRRQAQARLRKLLVRTTEELLEMREQRRNPIKSTVLEDFVDEWLRDVAPVKLRASTVAGYEHLLRRHILPVIGGVELPVLTRRHVQAAISSISQRAGRELSPRTHRAALNALRAVLRHARNMDVITHDPCDGLALPRARRTREQRALEREELRAVLDAAQDTPFEALWHLMAATGCRPGEALGLRWSDVDFEAGTVSIRQAVSRNAKGGPVLAEPKTPRSRRTIPLPPPVFERLRRHRSAQNEHALKCGARFNRGPDLVFPTRNGEPMSDRDLDQRNWRPLCAAAGVEKATPYSLRHTAATHLLASGVPVHDAARLLGHSPDELLRTYAHRLAGKTEEASRRLAEVLYG